MSNLLRSRLNRLSGNQETVSKVDDTAKMPNDEQSKVWAQLGVFTENTPHGSFLLRKLAYSLEHIHGAYQLQQLLDIIPALTVFDPGQQVSSEQLLFFDLETTGLGSGSGNIPFMTSIGYVAQEQFIIEQALICHPVEEFAMLSYMLDKMNSYSYLVTYNGKSFDWPLLQNRMVMNRLRQKQWQPKHIDLLHPSRAVWRNTLTSCKLSYVEEKRLGIERVDDVPGSLAPQLYFQYLAEQNPTVLEGVFRHNEWDILSLATLLTRFGQLLSGQEEQKAAKPTTFEELVRTGLWLEKMNVPSLAEPLYHLAKKTEDSTATALILLATRHKKAGYWSEAVLLWQKVIIMNSSSIESKLECYVEIAKFFEHREKNFTVALQYMNDAEQMLVSNRYSHLLTEKERNWLQQCRHRMNRLQNKLKVL
ncbi:ribonuclease H-like domain-containing protein [Paenibacillus yanchengensis]|uniref:Ribonuclease H-like domain-containing protein n=1 Tax=Paenibacillus yanchengensis TaxID=2035833 RepID=A0ABW4YQC2_9BACL